MKQFFKSMMSVAIVAMAFAGCSKDATEVTTPATKGITVKFKAEVIDETRATLTPNDGETEFKAAWENSDQIGLHIDSKNYNDEITNSYDDVLGIRTNGAFEAQFDTKPETAFWWDYYAYYPYNADNSYGNCQAHIPFGGERVQYGNNYNSAYDIMVSSGVSASTLEEGSNIEVGVDENGDAIVLPMKRMTAIAYFHFTTTKEAQTEKVLSVTISATPANESEPLASDQAYVHYGDKDSQGVMIGGTAVNTIKITYDMATAPTAADFKAWFNVLPGTFSSLTLDIETTNYTAHITRKSSATYAAGQLYKTVFNLDSKWVKKDGGSTGETASNGDILWSEDWTGFSENDVPTTNGDGTKVFNNGTISYTCTDGGSATKIYDANLAKGTAPELLLSKNSGKWAISGIPTGNRNVATLTFRANQNSDTYWGVSSQSAGVTIEQPIIDGDETNEYSITYIIQFNNVSTFDLIFTNSSSSKNTRIDDIKLVAGGHISNPTNISATLTPTELKASWTAVANASGYEWYLTAIGSTEKLLHGTTNEPRITATGKFNENTTYVLYVKSVAEGDYDAPEGYADESITCTAVASTTKTYTLTFPDDNKTSNGLTKDQYTSIWTAKMGNYSWSIANFNNNNWSNDWAYIKCGSKKDTSVASITTDWAIEEAIKKVTLTIDNITSKSVNSIKLKVASDSACNNVIETINIKSATGEQICNITTPTANCYYKIEFDCKKGSSNGLVQVSKVVYTNVQ